MPEAIVSVLVFLLADVSNVKAVAPPVLRKTSVPVEEAASSVTADSRPEVLSNVAASALEGMPTLQLPAAPQVEEEVLVQLSTVCARPAAAIAHTVATARSRVIVRRNGRTRSIAARQPPLRLESSRSGMQGKVGDSGIMLV